MSLRHGWHQACFRRFAHVLLRDKHGNSELVRLGLYYEGVPPPDVADRLNASFPIYLQKSIHQRIAVEIEKDDKSVL